MTEIEPLSTGEHGLEDVPEAGRRSASSEVSLTQRGAVAGTLRVNLRWRLVRQRSEQQGGGLRRLFRRESDPAYRGMDLDLGCLYQFTDGRRGVIQSVGRRDGDYARAPYMRLDRDDRMGTATGENIFINMDQSAQFRRILIFVMLVGGAKDLTKTDATVTIYPAVGPTIEYRLDDSLTARARSCAVAQILHRGPELVVHREMRYFTSYQSDIDKAYNWGMSWGPGPGKTRL